LIHSHFDFVPLDQVTFTFGLSFGNDNILYTKDQNQKEGRKFLKVPLVRVQHGQNLRNKKWTATS